MQLVLETIDGPHRGARTVVRAGEAATFGRTERANYAFARDAEMSGLHFAIRSTPQGFEISDLGSTNGTLLNGQTVAAAPLDDGAEIRAGQSRFKVRLEGAAVVASPETPRGDSIPFADGVQDIDPRVRREALFAAAWSGQSWLVAHCRKLAETPAAENWDALVMLAILGRPAELSRIVAVSRAEALGPRRLLLCGAFGHPALVDGLLDTMAGSDPALAATAGMAFAKITGMDVGSSRRAAVALEPDGPPSELSLPDAQKAIAHWKQVQAKFAGSTRVCRGFDISEQVNDAVFAELDMESRWEVRLRGRFYGTWRGSLRDVDAHAN